MFMSLCNRQNENRNIKRTEPSGLLVGENNNNLRATRKQDKEK